MKYDALGFAPKINITFFSKVHKYVISMSSYIIPPADGTAHNRNIM